MSAEVLSFRPAEDPDALWEQYRALAQAAVANPSLATDREHVEKTIRAHRRFAEALARSDRGAA